jgi:hypothetical protein
MVLVRLTNLLVLVGGGGFLDLWLSVVRKVALYYFVHVVLHVLVPGCWHVRLGKAVVQKGSFGGV